MSTSVVIVTYNSAKDITACIVSLQEQGLREIVVVDNASSDTTVQLVENMGVEVVELPTNEGFSAAANKGAALTRGKYILFFNPDAVASTGCVSKTEKYLDAHVNVGVAGMLLQGTKGEIELRSFGELATPMSLFTRHLRPFPMPIATGSVDWVSGGAMMVRRDVFNAVKGFDEGFFLYWEDMDFCRRVKDSGFEVVLVKEAAVVHNRGASLKNMRQKTAFYDKSADRYFQKHYAWYIWLPLLLLRRLYRLFSPAAY